MKAVLGSVNKLIVVLFIFLLAHRLTQFQMRSIWLKKSNLFNLDGVMLLAIPLQEGKKL